MFEFLNDFAAEAEFALSTGKGVKNADSIWNHATLRDRTEDEKDYIEFLKKKKGYKYMIFESLTNIIKRYEKKYGVIDLERISKETGYSIKKLSKTLNLMTEYENLIKAEEKEEEQIQEDQQDLDVGMDVELTKNPEYTRLMFDFMSGIKANRVFMAAVNEIRQNYAYPDGSIDIGVYYQDIMQRANPNFVNFINSIYQRYAAAGGILSMPDENGAQRQLTPPELFLPIIFNSTLDGALDAMAQNTEDPFTYERPGVENIVTGGIYDPEPESEPDNKVIPEAVQVIQQQQQQQAQQQQQQQTQQQTQPEPSTEGSDNN